MGDGEGAGSYGVAVLGSGSMKEFSFFPVNMCVGETLDSLAILELTKGQKGELQKFLEVIWLNLP